MERNRRTDRNNRQNKNAKKEQKIKKNKKEKRSFTKVLFIIFLFIFIVSAFYVLKWFVDIRRAEKITKRNISEISKAMKITKNKTEIDLSQLKSINSDIKIVIEFPVLSILQPVVQTSNNNFYIKHDIYKKQNLAGAIFADYKNRFDFFEKNIIIYGNNMHDSKTMFSPLTKFFETDFLEKLRDEEKIINIYNKNGRNRYKIFSAYKIEDKNIDLKNLHPKSENELEKIIPNLKKKSIYEFNKNEIKPKQIITLITSGKNKNERLILHAYIIEENSKNINKY